MNQQDEQWKKDITNALEQIEVPDSLFSFARELPDRMEAELNSSSDGGAGRVSTISPRRKKS